RRREEPVMIAEQPGQRRPDLQRAFQPQLSSPMPEHELTHLRGQESEFRKCRGCHPKNRPLGIAEDPLPDLLSIVMVRSGELDRVLQVLVVSLKKSQRRTSLAKQISRGHRSRPR